jgi:dTDP-4-dehydrorhamnose reductase
MKILVTGLKGQVTTSLQERGAARSIDVTAVGRPELDMSVPANIHAALSTHDFDVLVNAAAYTAVDKAETDVEAAMAINALGAEAVAKHASACNIPLIHISTDYVYKGDLDRPYVEDDLTGPLGVYGASKLRGEELVRQACPWSIILRTAWVYSPFGSNFMRTMLRLGESRDTVSVVADQFGNPTSALDIADAVIDIACRALALKGQTVPSGVFHLTGSGEATWADVAELIFTAAEEHGRAPVRVQRITTADYPTAAHRPANSRLNCAKLESTFGIKLHDWQQSAKICVGRLLGSTT